jgi:hypothetical protein
MNWSSKGVWCRGLGAWEKSRKVRGKIKAPGNPLEIHENLAHFLAIARKLEAMAPKKGVLFWNSETHRKAKAYFCSRSMDLICWNHGCDPQFACELIGYSTGALFPARCHFRLQDLAQSFPSRWGNPSNCDWMQPLGDQVLFRFLLSESWTPRQRWNF